MATARRRRTMFDLTPQELKELSKLNSYVCASVSPNSRARFRGNHHCARLLRKCTRTSCPTESSACKAFGR